MKLIYEITFFPLISTLSLYLISNLLGEVLIRGQRLKEGGAYFKVKEIQNTKQKTSKPKKKENINKNNSFIV